MQFDPKTASDADCELHIIRQLVTTVLDKGFTVSVYDGGAWPVKRSSDVATIMDALRSTDQDSLVIRDPTGPWSRVGIVHLIYGNSPWEVIADHTDTPQMCELLEPADAAAKMIEDARS
jgi:hypothetical protein